MNPLDNLYESYLNEGLSPQILWRAMEKTATNRVKKFFKWEDPDIVGNAVSKAMQELDNFKGTSKFSTWFIRFIDTECLMALRLKRRHPEAPLESSHWESLVTEEPNNSLYDAIDSLPASMKKLVLLQLEGYSKSEIATQLGVSHNQIKVQMLNALNRLKEIMKNGK
jgi:RNA polymerase sigma factor (sigma-70 family)